MLEYREITMADVEMLAVLYVEAFNAPPWNDQWTMETAETRLGYMIDVPGFYGICALLDGALCGLILGEREQFFDGVNFLVKEFCVDNSLRGKGIGRQLYEEFEARLKTRKFHGITLMTSRGEATEGFYKRLGFETEERLIIMRKQV